MDDDSGKEVLNFCRVYNIITQRLLLDYSRAHHNKEFDLAMHPLILRNAWPAKSFKDGNN